MTQLLSTGEVARLVGLPAHRIEYAHASGRLAEPMHKFLGKRVYLDDDVRRVARHFGVPLADRTETSGAGKEGA